jgi:FdhD protein
MRPSELSAGSIPAAGIETTGRQSLAMEWQVADERPIAIMFNSVSFAVMMATPADLVDLAVGFSLSEAIVASQAAITGVLALPTEGGFFVDIATATAIQPRPRTLEGRSGCGLCGVENIADAIRRPPLLTPAFALEPAAAAAALRALPAHQPMNRINRSVHGAFWCDREGNILLAREDVGRHNALDKLIGALSRQGADFTAGFVAMTSRCSFELVQKIANVGIAHLVTVSAPTSLALELARQAGVTLAAASRDGVVVFDGSTHECTA